MSLGAGIAIKVGDEVVGAISAGRAAGGDLDNACARAGLDKIKESAVTPWRARLTVRSPGRTVFALWERVQPWPTYPV